MTADGAALADCSRWEATVPVRTFVPDDLRLIKGSPRRRREYLDSLAGRCAPAHAGLLRRYEEALSQRNTLLRTTRPGGEDGQFAPWESILAQTGSAVSLGRAAALASFVNPFQRMYADLTGESGDALRLVYRTNAAGLDEADYRRRLAEMRAADRQRTYTHLGPHRDDLRLLRRGLDVRDCASQGEQRAALLALVLAEWGYGCASVRQPREQAMPVAPGPAPEPADGSAAGSRGRPGGRPLLLLDDVMSELDESRRRALVALVSQGGSPRDGLLEGSVSEDGLSEGGQTVMTTTDLRFFSTEELERATVVRLLPE